jgi:hypothetical protein
MIRVRAVQITLWQSQSRSFGPPGGVGGGPGTRTRRTGRLERDMAVVSRRGDLGTGCVR